jgi:hypothetical protein
MLVCRRFTSSTRKTPTHLLLDLKKLLGAADAASALADAVGEAARAVAAVVAAAGDVAAGSRRGE